MATSRKKRIGVWQKSGSFTESQKARLRHFLSSRLSRGGVGTKYSARRGGILSARCTNQACASYHSPRKRKLDIHLPTGAYSCWVCNTRGFLSSSDFLTRQLSHGPGDEFLQFVATLGDFGEKYRARLEGSGESWGGFISQIMSGGWEAEPEPYDPTSYESRESEKVLLSTLPQARLFWYGLEESRHYAWYLWMQRWNKYEITKSSALTPLAAAAIYDVRFEEVDKKIHFAFPGWNQDGRLEGIHWWFPRGSVNESGRYSPVSYRTDGDKGAFILGSHAIDWTQRVFLVEGVWDAMVGGKNTIPLLGSSLGRNSLVEQVLLHERPPEVCVVLDPDAQKKAWRIAQRITELGLKSTVLAPSENKDPAEMGVPITEWIDRVPPPVDCTWEEKVLARLFR